MNGKPSTEVARWADEAMFRSESHDASEGPKVSLLSMTPDPLAAVAACAKMYKGEVVRSFSDVTHEERKHYLQEMQKTKLKMPLEAVNLHFMIENVTRAFTHQLVRQRTAAYAQESMRFAVVEDMNQAVALPPSLAGFNNHMPDGRTYGDYIFETYGGVPVGSEEFDLIQDKSVRHYLRWRNSVSGTSETYNYLVNDGMPAEDARGLMPTNIITRVNYITNLRGLLDHAGNRLCTQAQFEWRLVFSQIARAIRSYRPHGSKIKSAKGGLPESDLSQLGVLDKADRWQFEAIADLLKPVCYQTGSCAFEADFDRKCSIRERVQANASVNRPSSQWHEPLDNENSPVFIGAIQPREWLADPEAAR